MNESVLGRPFLGALLAPLLILGWPLSLRAQPSPSAGAPMPAGMPNLRAIAGRPLPDKGMATGTVTVRLARKIPANAVTNTEITAVVEGPGGESRKRTAKTDASGRAFFESLPTGHRFQAEVTVDGEKLATDPFPIPDVGGVRVMLIADLAAGGEAGEAAADQKGQAGQGQGTQPEGQRQPFTLGLISGTVTVDPGLPFGTIEVLTLNESGQPLAGTTVELGSVHKGGKVDVTRQVTNAQGAARFLDVAKPGAVADIGAAVVMRHGELRLGTDAFGIPAEGGIRVQLRAPQRTSDPSVISVGAGGRFILQVRDDSLSFIETLPLENTSDKLFDPGPGGVEFRLPSEAVNAEGAEGGHKIEIRKGIGVAVHGIIPPRRPQADPTRKSPDEITFGFVLPFSGSSRSFEQTFANGFGEFTFITDQIAGLTIESSQVTGRQERELNGKKYWLSRGEPIPPGGSLRFTVRGLPAADTTGRTIAGALALALVLAAFIFGRARTSGAQPAAASEREKLVERREKLFSELVESESRDGVAPRADRGELIKKLEAIYKDLAALDERHAV